MPRKPLNIRSATINASITITNKDAIYLRKLGDGNLSAGIRKACSVVKGTKPG